jgi:hypothetical protein
MAEEGSGYNPFAKLEVKPIPGQEQQQTDAERWFVNENAHNLNNNLPDEITQQQKPLIRLLHLLARKRDGMQEKNKDTIYNPNDTVYTRPTKQFGAIKIEKPLRGQTLVYMQGEHRPWDFGGSTHYDLPFQSISQSSELSQLQHPLTDSLHTENTLLERPWLYQSKVGLSFFGTNDHSELLFQGVLGDLYIFNPSDTLVNFDPHHDIFPGIGTHPPTHNVFISSFVGNGAVELQAWQRYVQITPVNDVDAVVDAKGKVSRMYKNQQIAPPPDLETYQFSVNAMQEATTTALESIHGDEDKMIVTIDFDFFGCNRPPVSFNQENTTQKMRAIFDFILENREKIKIVHFAESTEYLAMPDEQRNIIYAEIAKNLVRIEEIASTTA